MIHCEREESTLLAAIHRDPHMLRIARIGGVGLGRRLIGGGVGGRLAGQAQCTTTSRGQWRMALCLSSMPSLPMPTLSRQAPCLADR